MSTVEQFWQEFLDARPRVPRDTPFQTWYFGNSDEMARDLARLVITGQKMASASLVAVNEIKPDEAPIIGGYSVVTYFDGSPACVIRTLEVCEMPFNQVDERFAADEGEGDLSLASWRDAHRKYFLKETAELGVEFTEDSIVCCERFVCLYPR